MKRYVATGYVRDGEVHLRNTRQLESEFKTWRNCELVVTFEKMHATRSLPQNDYYWSVVVARIQATFVKKGIVAKGDPVVTHEILKSQFMDPELVRKGKIRGYISDSGLTIGTHTPDLNKLEFMDYLDRIVDHAALHWETYVPPPDPLWREHAEAEAAREEDVA